MGFQGGNQIVAKVWKYIRYALNNSEEVGVGGEVLNNVREKYVKQRQKELYISTHLSLVSCFPEGYWLIILKHTSILVLNN